MGSKKKWNETKEFIRLQQEWYKKLDEETGFEDIEWVSNRTGGEGPYLRQKKLTFSIIPFGEAYYKAATEVALELLMDNIDSYQHIQLFALHADGVPGRDSAAIMGVSRETVRKALQPYIDSILTHAYHYGGNF